MSDRGVSPDELGQLTDPEFVSGPEAFDLWRRMRDDDPVAWTPEKTNPGFWSVTRYADGLRIFKDATTFSSAHGTILSEDRRRPTPASGKMLPVTDPPRHDQLRYGLSPSFRPKRLEELMPWVLQTARDLIGAVDRSKPFDLAEAVVNPLVQAVVLEIVGVPTADRARIGKLAILTDSSDLKARSAAFGELLYYFGDLVRSKRKAPADDVLSRIATLEIDGASLRAEEQMLNALIVPLAGLDTTRLAAIGGVLALAENVQQWERLKSNPDLVSAATEEVLRFTSPGMVNMRTATTDAQLGERHIAAGQQIALWIGSFNRDERVFPEPDRFLVDREPNRHVTFGSGVHVCLGEKIARLEIRALLEAIVEEWDSITVAGAIRWRRSVDLHGVDYLPLQVT